MACKKLNASDDLVLKQNKINVEAGEDVFRFHLVPEYNSDLPKITNSVLKTRSTLSLHKVYKYLIKKLMETQIEDISEELPPENFVVIVCNGVVLNPTMQLKTAYDLNWPYPERLLVLHYRRADEITQPFSPLSVGESFTQELQAPAVVVPQLFQVQTKSRISDAAVPRRPPAWVPSHLAFNCQNCNEEFHWLSEKAQNCRSCGRSFCNDCTQFRTKIPEFGYLQPVRVCLDCKEANDKR